MLEKPAPRSQEIVAAGPELFMIVTRAGPTCHPVRNDADLVVSLRQPFAARAIIAFGISGKMKASHEFPENCLEKVARVRPSHGRLCRAHLHDGFLFHGRDTVWHRRANLQGSFASAVARDEMAEARA